jgi:hypothetical protein
MSQFTILRNGMRSVLVDAAAGQARSSLTSLLLRQSPLAVDREQNFANDSASLLSKMGVSDLLKRKR